jgi:hypothetical protein
MFKRPYCAMGYLETHYVSIITRSSFSYVGSGLWAQAARSAAEEPAEVVEAL